MSIVHLNQENFAKEALQSDVPVIMDFWAPWCAPCQMMAPVFEELSNEYEGKLKFTKVNTDEEQMLAVPFGIQGIPTLLVLYKGQEVDRIVGFGPKEMLKQRIDEILAKIN